MRISPTLTEMATYPFVRLEEARRRLESIGVPAIDFGKGDPNEPTDERIRRALVESLGERSSYPLAQGLPELRRAVAAWCGRRFGVSLDPDREVIPTLGSKEAIFSLAQVLVDPRSEKRLVAYTEPGYPVYERGALFAGAETLALPLRAEHDFLPDLDAVDEDTWRRTAILWVNYPNNPTGATAPLDFYERLTELAARWDFALASDEAYSELWFEEPPVSALEVADRRQVVVFQTLSKRSSMTGYRSGFVAASPEVIAALKAFRPTVGTAPQEFVQRASIVAWDDEAIVGALDRGEIRVAEKVDGEWRVNEEAKQAILDYFRVRDMEPLEVGPFEYLDKIPLKHDYARLGVRVVPPATARYGSFLSPGVVVMPSHVNIRARVGPRTTVD